MPLRSVEAATRDDAVAAAREQYGPTARVVGVRRVRSGGVLGFFATERYVAEVAPQTGERPAAGAAARAVPDGPLEERARAAAASIARLTAAATHPDVDSDVDPVEELAGLLGAGAAEQSAALYTRTAFPRAVPASTAGAGAVGFPAGAGSPAGARVAAHRVPPVAPGGPALAGDDQDEPAGPPAGARPAPSPFTAALARMVAGDRDVRQAVARAAEGAVEQQPEPVDERREPAPAAEPATEPAAEPAAGSPREEAVAEMLRAALAQQQSDEELEDILRGVLTGSAPSQATLAADAPADLAPAAEPVWAQVAAVPHRDDLTADEANATGVVPRPPAPALTGPPSERATQVEEPAAAPPLARTASDPAPLPLDATTLLPRISLLPPLASPARSGSGRPPVPAPPSLARVVRLPVVPRPDSRDDESPGAAPTDVPQLPADNAGKPVETAPIPAVGNPAVDVVSRLVSLGLPGHLLGTGFAAEAEAAGVYAALTRALHARLPGAPQLPTGPGEVAFLVGPGAETLRAARALAAAVHLAPERVQWATRRDLAGLAPRSSRMTTVDVALERRRDAARAATVTIVAVDAPLRTDSYWMSQMLSIWSPATVWAVVEATRKPEDLEQWLSGLPRVDALVVLDTDLSADPAAVLARLSPPVALLDGAPATAHRWASLLCERLEPSPA